MGSNRGMGRRRMALGVVAAVVVLLGLAQVLLPRLAAKRVREKVGRYGTVRSVEVSAVPALRLLWGEAEQLTLRADRLELTPEQVAGLLSEAGGAERVDATAQVVQLGALRLTEASFQKHGSQLRGEALVSEADVRAALPQGVEVTLLSSADGSVAVRVSGGLFGLQAAVRARALAEDGKLVVAPAGGLLAGVRLTLFANRKVHVEGVQARLVRGTAGDGALYSVSIWASLS